MAATSGPATRRCVVVVDDGHDHDNDSGSHVVAVVVDCRVRIVVVVPLLLLLLLIRTPASQRSTSLARCHMPSRLLQTPFFFCTWYISFIYQAGASSKTCQLKF